MDKILRVHKQMARLLIVIKKIFNEFFSSNNHFLEVGEEVVDVS